MVPDAPKRGHSVWLPCLLTVPCRSGRRNGRKPGREGRLLVLCNHVADRPEAERREQPIQLTLGAVEIGIVTKSRKSRGTVNPRLLGIDLPRMNIKHKGPSRAV